MRYLKEIEDYGLYYKKNKKFDLRVYTNVDWTGNIDDKKITTRGVFFWGKRIVIWTSKKKNYISQFTTETEYVSAIVNWANIVWIKQLLKGMKKEITNPMVL